MTEDRIKYNKNTDLVIANSIEKALTDFPAGESLSYTEISRNVNKAIYSKYTESSIYNHGMYLLDRKEVIDEIMTELPENSDTRNSITTSINHVFDDYYEGMNDFNELNELSLNLIMPYIMMGNDIDRKYYNCISASINSNFSTPEHITMNDVLEKNFDIIRRGENDVDETNPTLLLHTLLTQIINETPENRTKMFSYIKEKCYNFDSSLVKKEMKNIGAAEEDVKQAITSFFDGLENHIEKLIAQQAEVAGEAPKTDTVTVADSETKQGIDNSPTPEQKEILNTYTMNFFSQMLEENGITDSKQNVVIDNLNRNIGITGDYGLNNKTLETFLDENSNIEFKINDKYTPHAKKQNKYLPVNPESRSFMANFISSFGNEATTTGLKIFDEFMTKLQDEGILDKNYSYAFADGHPIRIE